MKKINQKLKVEIILWLVITIIFFLRFTFIEADMAASWGVLNYQTLDEGIYGNLALNMVNFGSINPNDYYEGSTYVFLMQPHVIINVIGNFFTYLSLSILGDTLLGFRAASIILGYIILIFFFLILRELWGKFGNDSSKAYFIIYFFMLYLTINFVFYNASRLAEPTLHRLLFLQMIVFIFIKRKMNENLRNYLLGFVTIVSVFLVYITNVFIGIALLANLFFLMSHKEYKKAKSYVIWGGMGGVTAYILSFVYYYFCWGTTPIVNAFNCITQFQYSPYYAVDSNFVLNNLKAFISSNSFLYNIGVFSIFLLGLVYFAKCAKRKKDILFLLSLIFGLLLQTIFSEDFIVRKSLVILPCVMYLGYLFIINIINEKRIIQFSKKHLVITGILTTGILVYIVLYRLCWIDNGTNLDFSRKDRIILLTVLVGTSILIFLFCVFVFFSNMKLQKLCLFGMLLVSLVANTLFLIKYNLINQTYTDKKIMVELGKMADNRPVLGEFENGLTLYNNILPLLNTDETLKQYMEKDNSLYYFHFDDYENFNHEHDSLNQNVKRVKTFQRQYQTLGVSRGFALYKYSDNDNEESKHNEENKQ